MSNDSQLKAFTERRERLEAEKQDALDAIKDLNAELKSSGYDLKVFNTMIARRKKDRNEVAEADAMLKQYELNLEGV
jgi:uncharacterized protein (UPF0335 family)